MTWVASHQSPTGLLSRFTLETREAAALMLYTAMSRSGASKPLPQMKRLLASVAGTDFIATVDGHWFALSRLEPIPSHAGGVKPATSPNSDAGRTVFHASRPASFCGNASDRTSSHLVSLNENLS